MRIIHLLVIGVLVFAAAYVYRIKMESTLRTERVLRLNAEIREQRDAIAALRAEWAKLDAPLRLQGLAERHLALKPLERHAIRFIEEPARAAAEPGQAGRSRSDRRDDPERSIPLPRRARCRRRRISDDRSGARTVRPAEPWRQRLIRSLLYGRNVDRAVKARVRVGFAMVAFAAIYAVIGGRLVMFAVGGDNHGGAPGRGARRDRDRAAGYRRSQRRSARHRRQNAEPVRRAAPDHRQGRGDRASDRDAARSRHRRSARTPVVEKRFCVAEARDHPEAATGNSPPRHSRHRLPAREQAGLPDRQRSRASDRPGQHRQRGHRRDGEMARQQWSCRSASRRLRDRPSAAAGGTVGRPARRARAARRTAQGQGKIQGQGGVRPRFQRQDRRDRGDGVAARLRSE